MIRSITQASTSPGSNKECVPSALMLRRFGWRFGRRFLKKGELRNFLPPAPNQEGLFERIRLGGLFHMVIPPHILKPVGKNRGIKGFDGAIVRFGRRIRPRIQPQFRPNDEPDHAIRGEQHACNLKIVMRHTQPWSRTSKNIDHPIVLLDTKQVSTSGENVTGNSSLASPQNLLSPEPPAPYSRTRI